MTPVSTLTCYKMEREILHNKIVLTEKKHQLVLSDQAIKTDKDLFLLTEIYDLSYRTLSSTIYLVHVYTVSGVLTFQTEQDPHLFKQFYLQLKDDSY